MGTAITAQCFPKTCFILVSVKSFGLLGKSRRYGKRRYLVFGSLVLLPLQEQMTSCVTFRDIHMICFSINISILSFSSLTSPHKHPKLSTEFTHPLLVVGFQQLQKDTDIIFTLTWMTSCKPNCAKLLKPCLHRVSCVRTDKNVDFSWGNEPPD